jgi:hypothetical protein
MWKAGLNYPATSQCHFSIAGKVILMRLLAATTVYMFIRILSTILLLLAATVYMHTVYYTTVIGSYYTCLYAYCILNYCYWQLLHMFIRILYTILLLLASTTHVSKHTVYYTTVIGSYYTCLYAYCILFYCYWQLLDMFIRILYTILLLLAATTHVYMHTVY